MKIGLALDTLNGLYSRYGCKQFEVLKKHGFDAVDYSMAKTTGKAYTNSAQENEKFFMSEKKLMQDAGVVPYQVHGPWRFPPINKTTEDRREFLEFCKKSLFATSLLECKNWVIHPLFPYSAYPDNLHVEQTRQINLEFAHSLIDIAKPLGITICFENMPFTMFSLSRPRDILDFVKEVNDESFKICFDSGHANIFKDITVPEAIRLLGSEIKVFHIHDNSGENDEHRPIKTGTIDWDDTVKAIKEIGHEGVFSLEIKIPKIYEDKAFETEMINIYTTVKNALD